MTSTAPRLFHLERDTDVTGVSGTGRVADGVQWPDGTVALRWIGDRPSTVLWGSVDDVAAIHGHGGATRIVWADGQPDRAELRDRIEVWPLARVLKEVRCGSEDWSWEEEWADLDRRHADTGYLATLEQQIRERGITMPVLIGSDGRLWDGHHRLRIAVRLGIPYVPVELTPPADAVRRMADQTATETPKEQ